MSTYGYIIHNEMSGYAIAHHGIKGQKWGIRRYQNPDGSLTEAGKKRYQGYVYGIEKKRDTLYKATNAYTSGLLGASLIGIVPTLGASLIPGIAIAETSNRALKKIDDHYDKKLSNLRNGVKESSKLEKDLYKKNSDFKKIRDSYNSRKKVEKEREIQAAKWEKEVERTEKLLDKSRNICNSKSASSSDKVKAFKNYMENAIENDDYGGFGKPEYSSIYYDKDSLRENVDWLADQYGLTLTESERDAVVNSYSSYFKKK